VNKELFKYLDDQLTTEDRAAFERKLARDRAMQYEVDQARLAQSKLDDMKETVDLTDYFNTSRVDFHKRNQSVGQSQSRFGALVLPGLSFACTILLLFTILHDASLLSVNADYELVQSIRSDDVFSAEQYTSIDALSIAETIPAEFQNTDAAESALLKELALTKESAQSVSNEYSISTDELISSVTNEEYAQTLNKISNLDE
jgi:hypothetical protein